MMKARVLRLDGEEAGEVELSDAVFGLEPRGDILHRVVVWQEAKARSGTRRTKTRGEIARTGKKAYAQKRTGNARHGSRAANLFRGGAKSHGPVVRSHDLGLPKKFRALGLRHALSSRALGGEVLVLEEARLEGGKTKVLRERLEKLGALDALVVESDAGYEEGAFREGFLRALRNLPTVRALPVKGVNVRDVLRRGKLVMTVAGARGLEERLS